MIRLFATVFLLFAVLTVRAGLQEAVSDKNPAGGLKNIKADKWTVIGNNVILEGNVIVPAKHAHLTAEKAIINIQSRDIETFGKAHLISRSRQQSTVSPAQLAKLQTMPNVLVEVTGLAFPSNGGNPSINVTVYYVTESLTTENLSGNLLTGYFAFDKATCQMKDMTFTAGSGVRQADGNIVLKDAEFSSCNYLEEDNAHYAITASEAKLYTHQNNGFDIQNYDFTIGEHSILAKNSFFKIYGIPVFWLPGFYKPKDEHPGLFKMDIGATSDWGFFMSMSKKIEMTDYPHSTVNILADYYTKRGFGYGVDVNIDTENSKTNIFAYSIYDINPYESSQVWNQRMKIPYYRYDVRFSNVTHITPRLDFRAYVEFMSDMYMQNDYFQLNYNNNPEPASYVALERQFDYFTTSLYARMQTNNFFTTAQKLPEFRIDVPRVELFGSNLYYQGEHSLDYLIMNWRTFDKPRNVPNFVDPANYSTMRLDSVNFLYYPIKLDWLNLLPRAGVRMTYYTNSSSKKVDADDLQDMFIADMPEGVFSSSVSNYNNKGGGRLRFAGEFGMQANTKIHRTYQNVRSELFGLDGLRHVMVPYVNYTYITSPSQDRDYLYFFDDIDRIEKQNFFRFGLQNRFQTRSNNRLINTFTMENYWDLFVEREKGFNNIGDFCTKLTTSPLKGLVISTLFSINAGGNDTDRMGTIRNGKITERKGISGTWLNRWIFSITYEPVQDFIFNFSYAYQDAYSTQSLYSMGSSLTDLESGSAFDKTYNNRTQQLIFGLGVPLTPDRRTKATYQMLYDFEMGMISHQRIGITHQLHCWEFALMLAQSVDLDNGKRDESYSVTVSATLNGVKNPVQQVRGEMPELYRFYTQNNILGGL